MILTKLRSFIEGVTPNRLLLFGTYSLYLVAIPLSTFTSFGKDILGNSDFLAYYSAGKTVNERSDDLMYDRYKLFDYQAPYTNSAKPFLYLPATVLPYVFLSRLSFEVAFLVHYLLSLVILMYSIFILNIFYKFTDLQRILLLTFPAVFIVLGLGQISMILLLSVTLVYYFQKSKKEFLAGLFLGLVLIKYQYSALVPFVLILSKDRLKFLMGFLTSTFVLVFTSFLFFGNNIFIAYIHLLKTLPSTMLDDTQIYGVSIMSLRSIFQNTTVLYLATFLIFSYVCAFLYFSQKNKSYDLLYISALAYSLILAPYALIYDTIVLLPLIAVVLNKNNFYKNWMFYFFFIGLFVFQVFGLSWVAFILLGVVAFSITNKSFSNSV